MLSSKSREKKKLDQKDQKKLLQGIEPESGVYHLQIRSIYGHIRLEISNTVPVIRRTEDTAYIRSYGLGQPYVYYNNTIPHKSMPFGGVGDLL
jgi:hypothetical protein